MAPNNLSSLHQVLRVQVYACATVIYSTCAPHKPSTAHPYYQAVSRHTGSFGCERKKERKEDMERETEMKQSKFKRICVFCGSSPGNKTGYKDAAIELGRELVMFLSLSFVCLYFSSASLLSTLIQTNFCFFKILFSNVNQAFSLQTGFLMYCFNSLFLTLFSLCFIFFWFK